MTADQELMMWRNKPIPSDRLYATAMEKVLRGFPENERVSLLGRLPIPHLKEWCWGIKIKLQVEILRLKTEEIVGTMTICTQCGWMSPIILKKL